MISIRILEYYDSFCDMRMLRYRVFQKGDTPFDIHRIRQPWFQQITTAITIALQFPVRVWRYGWPSLTMKK